VTAVAVHEAVHNLEEIGGPFIGRLGSVVDREVAG
jgi:hypothetical protein